MREVPDDYIEAVASVMVKANWHTYQVLTKRSKRLRNLLSTRLQFAASARHIWWGVSVEDKRYGLARIPDLQSAPATVRFLSIEPLLEDLGRLQLRGIHWVIVGGESGRSARPMKREWVVSIRDQCVAADVPFFFKQWGGFHKKRAGRMLDGRPTTNFRRGSKIPYVLVKTLSSGQRRSNAGMPGQNQMFLPPRLQQQLPDNLGVALQIEHYYVAAI